MLECYPKGCWLCKGPNAECRRIPFLGLKKTFSGEVKGCTFWVANLLNLEIYHVYCICLLQTGVIWIQSALWLTNICQPEVLNT